MSNLQIVVACQKNVEAQYVEMKVPLYSYGCERKVKKALSHLRGIYSVSVDYNEQKVTVWGICDKHDVLATIRSKRKEARFWNIDDNKINDELELENDENDNYLTYKPSLSLTKFRSFSWKTVKKVFTRSHSF